MKSERETQKERVDALLVKKGFFSSREQAKRAIMAGLVFSPSERIDKPGMKVPVDLPIRVKEGAHPYVSRGGLKLEKAIQSFQLDLQDKVVVDVGASTGGFTDCALQHGAKLVYAIDVGYGQLDWRLRNDERVIVMERTNFRYITEKVFNKSQPDFACVDVSFISLRHILPPLYSVLKPGSEAVLLIKPQFEAGKEFVGKKGLVKDPRVHRDVLLKVAKYCAAVGFNLLKLTPSPVRGAEGNIEFLGLIVSLPDPLTEEEVRLTENSWLPKIEEVVMEAHRFVDSS